MMPVADIIPLDLRSELQKFDQAAAQLIASFFKTIEVPWPPTIYHYTNDIGLRGILETGKLWLTDMFNLNDPSELSHSLSHIVDTLNSKAATGLPESKIFSQAFEAYLRQGGYQKVAHYFLCSFSAVGDDLGQWRAYADNGRGYALGFDAGELVTAFNKPSGKRIPNNATLSMTYNDSKSIEIHKQIVDQMFHLISIPHDRGLESAVVRAYENHLYALLAMESSRVGLVFKHEAYNNEKEYRFVEMHGTDVLSADVKFRSRPYSIVKYREFDWRSAAPGALKKIVIGPGNHDDRAFKFATDCLGAFHGTGVQLFRSRIPYRAT